MPVSRIVDAEQAEGIAQFVVMMALRHARALPLYEAQQRERQWKRNPIAAVRSKVAVLGTGAMGSVVVRLLGAVGFEARGWSRASAEPLESVLGASDIVVCALPLTAQTEGLLDAAAFAAMPRGSYLINIARGGHVVEADLIDAVRSGQLAGAALDVQRREPMAPDDPLWTVPGITITPHIAAQPSTTTIAAQFVEGLRCIERRRAAAAGRSTARAATEAAVRPQTPFGPAQASSCGPAPAPSWSARSPARRMSSVTSRSASRCQSVL